MPLLICTRIQLLLTINPTLTKTDAFKKIVAAHLTPTWTPFMANKTEFDAPKVKSDDY